MKKLTATQRKILVNVTNGRAYDYRRPMGMSAAGGWVSSFHSCRVHGWIDAEGKITDAGQAALA